MRQPYAAGSIVEAIETRQLAHNNNVQPDRAITVSAVNGKNMTIFTTHYHFCNAQWQRDWHKSMGHTNIN